MKQLFTSLVLFTFLLNIQFLATGTEKISPSLQFQYLSSNNLKTLKVSLTFSRNREEFPLPGIEITYFAGLKKNVVLGKIMTNETGNASFLLRDDMKLPLDAYGAWYFVAEFSGNDTLDEASGELTIQNVRLEMNLTETDSTETIHVKAFRFEKGKEIPVLGETVSLVIPRMFSMYPLAELELDEKGTARFDFPAGLPGDKDGNLTIISKFDDHPDFGTVEQKTTIKWGKPSAYTAHETHRALWTKGAPTWMIIALSIMLAGVWGHYLYAIICLIRIKLSSKKKVEEIEIQ